MPKTAAVFGAGIAGLSAAHEFARLGYVVSVYEADNEAGGFFRSARAPDDRNMPSQCFWHGMGPWYHNLFDLLRQIPFDETGNVYDKGLSRPIDFCLAPDTGRAAFYSGILDLPKMFRMGRWEGVRWAWLLLKTWASDRRSREYYSRLNAAEQWKPVLSDLGWRTWRASFGPWIGSDWTNVSLHQAGQFFRKQLMTKPSHPHKADDEGPAWTHGARDGWLLRQPKWVTTTDTQPYQPTQATPVPNLVLAGAHTETEADVWSIEGAVESGRRAARVIEPSVKVIPQYKPVWLRVISAVDNACFAVGAPHVLDLILVGCAIALAGVIAIAVLW